MIRKGCKLLAGSEFRIILGLQHSTRGLPSGRQLMVKDNEPPYGLVDKEITSNGMG